MHTCLLEIKKHVTKTLKRKLISIMNHLVAVIQGIHLMQSVIVGAGTLLYKDLADNALLVGAPPQPIKPSNQEIL